MVAPTRNSENIEDKQVDQPAQQGATVGKNLQLKMYEYARFFVHCYGHHNIIKLLISPPAIK